jgi:anti-sigma factor RsiW
MKEEASDGKQIDCKECEELLQMIAEYVDGEADEELRRELLLHAQTCGDCARLLRSFQRLVHYCHLEPNCEMPARVRHELWITIRQEIGPD